MTKKNPEGNITWDKFKEVLTEKFIPPGEIDRLYDEFYDLKQGDMTIR